MIQEKFDTGELEGIQLGSGEKLTHQLFANDTRVFIIALQQNFQCMRDIIARYKAILGVSLNLRKLIVIPLYLNGPIPY